MGAIYPAPFHIVVIYHFSLKRHELLLESNFPVVVLLSGVDGAA